MAFTNRELLARIIMCEAGGEGDNGMKAVGGVVMNRVNATGGEYKRLGRGNIRSVIYQEGQFDCVEETLRSTYNAQNIYNMRPSQLHYDIADWVIGGNRLTSMGRALWYFNPFIPTCRDYFPTEVGRFLSRIGDHCFYNPTAAYFET